MFDFYAEAEGKFLLCGASKTDLVYAALELKLSDTLCAAAGLN